MPQAWKSHTATHPLLTRGIELLGFDPFERLADGTRSHQPALFLCSMRQWASGDGATPIAAADTRSASTPR